MSECVETGQTPYDMIGGAEGVRVVVDRFYEIMDGAPYARTIRAMHGEDLSPMRERLFYFLSGWLGGPSLFFDKRPGVCIRSAHAPFKIGEAERDEWLQCMTAALEDVGVAPETRDLLKVPLFRIADAFRSR